MTQRANHEFRAMKRAALVKTAVELAVLLVVLLGLGEGAFSVAKKLAGGPVMTVGLLVVFGSALTYLLWSHAKRKSTWSDHLKNIVSLDKFLTQDPARRVLAPELDEDSRAALLTGLQSIAARDDVTAVSVGLLPEDGYISDRVLIKTFASLDVVRQWTKLLQTEFQTVAILRYDIDGKRRKVRSLLFVWN